jgi:2'-5' RNA ligase
MKNMAQLMPGYRVAEYLLVLTPHEELRNRIISIRKEFQEAYPGQHSIWGRPHLALSKFSQLEMLEERVLNRMKVIAMGLQPIKIELRDFGSFPTHTIYIQATSKEPIRAVLKGLREMQRLMKLDKDNKPHFMDEPHIPIARKLLPWQYEKGWLEYSQRHFTGRFIADGMLLLKRREGEKAWQISQRFEFQNLPVSIRQGELF